MGFKLSPAIQIWLSTAEDAENYFTAHESPVHEPDFSTAMPAGVYRIIDDELFQIAPAASR